jgi:hypothetical protein
METSEDEERTRKEAEERARKARRGLTEEEINADIDIVLSETNTTLMFNLPSLLVSNESEEYPIVQQESKDYDVLLENKTGSDSYMARGT